MFKYFIYIIMLLLAGCASKTTDGPPIHYRDVSKIPNAIPRDEPLAKYGNPVSYEVFGKRYYTLKDSIGYSEKGWASWYGSKFHGQRTSSGEIYDAYGMTAAHKTLPLPTYARVTNLKNGKSIIVKINDRGPFHDGRIIDLSYAAAQKLGILANGTAPVKVTAVSPNKTPVQKLTQLEDFADQLAAYIQLGAFSERKNAEHLQEELADIDNLHITMEIKNKQKIYKVRLGPFKQHEQAVAQQNNLPDFAKNNSFIVIE